MARPCTCSPCVDGADARLRERDEFFWSTSSPRSTPRCGASERRWTCTRSRSRTRCEFGHARDRPLRRARAARLLHRARARARRSRSTSTSRASSSRPFRQTSCSARRPARRLAGRPPEHEAATRLPRARRPDRRVLPGDRRRSRPGRRAQAAVLEPSAPRAPAPAATASSSPSASSIASPSAQRDQFQRARQILGAGGLRQGDGPTCATSATTWCRSPSEFQRQTEDLFSLTQTSSTPTPTG